MDHMGSFPKSPQENYACCGQSGYQTLKDSFLSPWAEEKGRGRCAAAPVERAAVPLKLGCDETSP